jgi:PE family protein
VDILKAGPISGGGGFELTPEELAAQLAEWEDLRRDILADTAKASKLAATPPSGSEAASGIVADLARRSGDEFLRHNTAMLMFVNGHVNALKAARDSYANSEEKARHRLGRHG